MAFFISAYSLLPVADKNCHLCYLICGCPYTQEGPDKVVEEVRELFARRKDRLQLRRVALSNGSTSEQFENGAGPCMLETLMVTSNRQRCMTFKAAARADGLRLREQALGHSMIETFQGRADQLLIRKCKYVPDTSDSER